MGAFGFLVALVTGFAVKVPSVFDKRDIVTVFGFKVKTLVEGIVTTTRSVVLPGQGSSFGSEKGSESPFGLFPLVIAGHPFSLGHEV
jgi:hypothetical protein